MIDEYLLDDVTIYDVPDARLDKQKRRKLFKHMWKGFGRHTASAKRRKALLEEARELILTHSFFHSR